MSPMVVMGLIHLGLAAILFGINLPLLRGRIPMNRWYGFRIAKAFRSNQNWYLINAYGARKMIRACTLIVPFALLEFFLPLGKDSFWITLCSLVPIVLLVGPLFSTLKYAKSL